MVNKATVTVSTALPLSSVYLSDSDLPLEMAEFNKHQLSSYIRHLQKLNTIGLL